jgi:hypothetical protein
MELEALYGMGIGPGGGGGGGGGGIGIGPGGGGIGIGPGGGGGGGIGIGPATGGTGFRTDIQFSPAQHSVRLTGQAKCVKMSDDLGCPTSWEAHVETSGDVRRTPRDAGSRS